MSRSSEYETYIKSPAWRRTAEAVKRHFGYVCKRCRYSGWDVEVHHLNYDRLGRELFSDLEVLCKSCHKIADRERALANAADSEDQRQEAAYRTYMEKKYGEDWYEDDSFETREEFDEWLERKQEQEMEDY
ncbi:MAG: hypothetical protein R3F13_00525 [Prosthecobacter sp.]